MIHFVKIMRVNQRTKIDLICIRQLDLEFSFLKLKKPYLHHSITGVTGEVTILWNHLYKYTK